MIFATFNIDWARCYKSKSHKHKIEEALNKVDMDILVVTESVDLNLPAFKHVYKTRQLPSGIKVGTVENNNYFKGTAAHRVTIYSKLPSLRFYEVTDELTSICREFDTGIGKIAVYGTIIGTLYNKSPYLDNELNNCIKDCINISQEAEYFCLAGDLNTSFNDKEKEYQMIGKKRIDKLREMCESCKLDLTTKDLAKNIDHIILSKSLVHYLAAPPKIFIEKNDLSDHQGVLLNIQFKSANL